MSMWELGKLWVDPAMGSLWGFPAIWDKSKHKQIEDLYKEKNYPEKYWHLPCRCWSAEDEQKQTGKHEEPLSRG